jgi:hypothetical protein
MPDADSATFRMVGAREVLLLLPGTAHIERLVVALEGAVNSNPALAFDLTKSLIESVCKTLLQDRGKDLGDDLELSQLFRETLANLRLLPETHSGASEARNSLKKTLGGLHTVVQGVCELRNAEGFASHGKYGYALSLEPVQAQLVARAADALVHFLLAAHAAYPSSSPSRRMIYEHYEELNQFIDEANDPVEIFDLVYRPSEVLFNVDLEAYRNLLANLKEETDEDKQSVDVIPETDE